VSCAEHPSNAWLTLRVFLPFVAGYYVSYAFRSMNALLGPHIAAELDLGAADLGLLTSVYFLAFALFQIPLGVLLDRYGPRRVDCALLLVAAAGAFVFALAPSFTYLIVGRALIGLGVSVCLMGSFQAFALWYPKERLATINSRAFAVGILGAMTVSVPLEMALRVSDWRSVAAFFALVTLAASAALFFAAPERKRAAAHDSLAVALGGVRTLLANAAFRRTVVMVSASQCAAMSLATLWIATWLRDVAGYDAVQIGRALLAVNCALIAGFLVFGRLAELRTRRGASMLPLIVGGVGTASVCLALLALGVTVGALALWAIFTFASSSATLAYALLLRRFPTDMAGRLNTTLNSFVFLALFLGQWAVGLVLELWPRSGAGYPAEAYHWALGTLWLLQLAGLAWFWRGRRLFANW
jgi:predicted MFS family arabinose efflux permease